LIFFSAESRIDIGEAENIDSIINDYIEKMKQASIVYNKHGISHGKGDLNAIAKMMYKVIMKPIEPYIKGKKHLYISPDSNLNLIPFEVLLDPDDKYLLEDYMISYIGAGRDIARFNDTTVTKNDALIMADPDYDMGLEEIEKVTNKLDIRVARVRGSVSKDADVLQFGRLPDTKEEADAIEKLLKGSYKLNVKNYQDKNALEEVLLQTDSTRIIHISTHGYFLKGEELKRLSGRQSSFEMDKIRDLGIENPMLRSGIVLAGANTSLKEKRDDGIVSAEKILGLKLKGTELVVLSACNTGVGEVQSGEGVFGLKRAFLLSGAKTLVMSLWNVPSKETTELMVDFYTLMAEGKSKAEALRVAKMRMMEKNPHPFFWGAFVMTGDPGKMKY